MPELEKTEAEKKAEEKERDDKARRDAEEAKEKEEEEARADAARRDEKLDKLLSGIKVLSDRMDSLEKKDDPEEEQEQAEELHELAEEEEQEAVEQAEAESAAAEDSAKKRDDKSRRDARAKLDAASRKFDAMCDRMKNDGRKRYDKVRGRMDAAGKKLDARPRRDAEEEKEMPWEDVERKDGEGDEEYSDRADGIAAKHDSAYQKRDDESIAAHCDRLAKGARRDRALRADRARMDSIDRVLDTVSSLSSRVDRLTRQQEARSPEDENAFAAAQSRADQIFQAFGDSAPRPLSGQNLIGYRILLLRGLQKHSPTWKDTDVATVARSDASAFTNIEGMIYADALKASEAPIQGERGQLRAISRRLASGHTETKFAGSPLSWMSTFMSPGRTTTRLRPPTAR